MVFKKAVYRPFGITEYKMCQFHMVAIIRRNVTKNPQLEAGKELWILHTV